MENALNSRLQSVQFAEVQKFKNIAILPLVAEDGGFRYRTLGEALATSDVTIKEVSTAGSVPELLATNRSDSPVLLLDGEELAGAKQNRVLNTSILLKESSETRLPVSCTEQGRWSYASPSFAESENVMAQRARASKCRSVSHSLQASATYHSDQCEVWRQIAHLQTMACCPSPTSAMDDVFTAYQDDLRRAGDVFHCVPGQVGLFAFADDVPAGFDLLSLRPAYAKVHAKLVRSYTIESLIRTQNQDVPPQDRDFAGLAGAFLRQISTAEQRHFPSVGYGIDYRYQGGSLAGAALVHADEAIHAAFFRMDTFRDSPPDGMASLRYRRRHYGRPEQP
jgi:hypothetical protein